ncbi:MAG: class I SAM-dependent methyltransferase [Lachnospiraceae bacterium]|nr:class I SAM-dependent methyltransferase [Lachnospiraceae bacterium]
MKNTNIKTLDYYNQNADQFVKGTVSVDFRKTQDRFLGKLSGIRVLDFGCGSGRDTKYFIEAGYDVVATDGSEKLCKSASEYTGIDVRQMLFQELDEIDRYDGIWACSSILHLPKEELEDVFVRMTRALCLNGIIYTSFKYGTFEGERNGRFFTDFTIDTFEDFIKNTNNISIEDYWITGDVRPGRENEQWLNLILRKTSS